MRTRRSQLKASSLTDGLLHLTDSTDQEKYNKENTRKKQRKSKKHLKTSVKSNICKARLLKKPTKSHRKHDSRAIGSPHETMSSIELPSATILQEKIPGSPSNAITKREINHRKRKLLMEKNDRDTQEHKRLENLVSYFQELDQQPCEYV